MLLCLSVHLLVYAYVHPLATHLSLVLSLVLSFISLPPSVTFFSSLLMQALTINLTRPSVALGSQHPLLIPGAQTAQSASASSHGNCEVPAQSRCSLSSPGVRDAQMPLPAIFPEGPPVSHCTRLLSSRESSLTTTPLCSCVPRHPSFLFFSFFFFSF